jgi:hypothetical protein
VTMKANTEDEQSCLSKLHTSAVGGAGVDLTLELSRGSRTSCNLYSSAPVKSATGKTTQTDTWCANSRKISGMPSSNTRFVLTLQSFTRYSVEAVSSSINRRQSTTKALD